MSRLREAIQAVLDDETLWDDPPLPEAQILAEQLSEAHLELIQLRRQVTNLHSENVRKAMKIKLLREQLQVAQEANAAWADLGGADGAGPQAE